LGVREGLYHIRLGDRGAGMPVLSTTTYTDTNAVGTGPFFYRVGVGN
jgi:hypothetical protein